MSSKKFDPQTHALTLTKPTQISPAADHPPRISEAIFLAPAGKAPQFRTSLETTVASGTNPLDFSDKDPATFDKSLKLLLQHIYERLDKGLEEAWRSEKGYDGDPEKTEEEEWARLFCELVIYAGYSGIKYAYSTKNMSEGSAGQWEMIFMARCCHAPDPVFPISLACQHLSTLAILTRGYPTSDVSTLTNDGQPVSSDDLNSLSLADHKKFKGAVAGVSAGGNGGLPVFKTKGKWIPASTSMTLTKEVLATQKDKFEKRNNETGKRDFKDLIATHGLSPGSIFGFNPNGPEANTQPDGSHVGTVLRVVAQPPAYGIQGIDTGPLGGGADDNVTADHDYQLGALRALNKHDRAQNGNLLGIGILPKQPPTTAALDVLRQARPIGLARLVLFDDGNRVRFIGPALPMHKGNKGFPVSKLVWSLRDLPSGSLRGLWLVTTPRDAVAQALLEPAGRSRPIAQSFQSAGVDYGKISHTAYSMERHVIASESTGAVSLFRFKAFKQAGEDVEEWVDRKGNGQGRSSKNEKGHKIPAPVPFLSKKLQAGASSMSALTALSSLGSGASRIWRSSSTKDPEDATTVLQDLPYFGESTTAGAAQQTPAPSAQGDAPVKQAL